MTRNDYLTNPTVKDFIEWLSGNLDNATIRHQYLNRQSKTLWYCDSLADAYSVYQWQHPAIKRLQVPAGKTAVSNDVALSALKADLQKALALAPAVNDGACCQAAIDVMIWGGVQSNNVTWLNMNLRGLAATLSATRDAIDAGVTDVPILQAKDLRFNAGMTKVYSLVCKDFIIYDSRVAAALGWGVVMYCKARQLKTVPETLTFPWAPAKETGKHFVKSRNPSEGTLRFPRLKAGSHHAEWNMKASWILSSVVAHPNAAASAFLANDGTNVDPLRRLEAALFMIGYDLWNYPEEDQGSTQQFEQDLSWIDCCTPTRCKPFRYKLTDEGFSVEGGPYFPIGVVNKTLGNLQKTFGIQPFPLANKADNVRNGDSAEGIGTAYHHATNGRGNIPDTSKLAAILENLGVFTVNHSTKLWALNADLLATNVDGQPDIAPVILRTMDEDTIS